MQPGHQRRIDRVTDPAYLSDLPARSPDEVRTMRDDCREEEARLSYARRVLQGQLDLARAEAERRGGGDDRSLLGALPDILADEPATPRRQAHATHMYDPEIEAGRREEDGLVHDAALSRLPELTEDELRAFIERVAEREQQVSGDRRRVLHHLDLLQDELVTRYRAGTASVDDIVGDPED